MIGVSLENPQTYVGGAIIENGARLRVDAPLAQPADQKIEPAEIPQDAEERSMQTVSPGPNLILGLTGHREGSPSSKPTRAMTA